MKKRGRLKEVGEMVIKGERKEDREKKRKCGELKGKGGK